MTIMLVRQFRPGPWRTPYAITTQRSSRLPLWMAFLVPLLAILLPILATAAYVRRYGWDSYACLGILAIGSVLVVSALILASPKGMRR